MVSWALSAALTSCCLILLTIAEISLSSSFFSLCCKIDRECVCERATDIPSYNEALLSLLLHIQHIINCHSVRILDLQEATVWHMLLMFFSVPQKTVRERVCVCLCVRGVGKNLTNFGSSVASQPSMSWWHTTQRTQSGAWSVPQK